MCVFVSVSVLVSVSVCVEERRCGVVTLKSPKKHISEKNTILTLSSSIANQTLYLYLTKAPAHRKTRMNG